MQEPREREKNCKQEHIHSVTMEEEEEKNTQ